MLLVGNPAMVRVVLVAPTDVRSVRLPLIIQQQSSHDTGAQQGGCSAVSLGVDGLTGDKWGAVVYGARL